MISFVASPTKASVLALLVHEGRFLTLPAQDADIALSGVIGNALKVGRFSGAKSSSYVFPASAGSAHPLIALIGAGPEGDLDPVQSEQIGASAYLAVKTSGEEVLSLDLRHLPVEAAARAGMGAYLAAYRFDKYLTQEKPDKKPSITSVEIVVTDPAAAEAAFAPLKAIAEGVNFTRDLVSEPANVLFPAEFARRAKALETLGLSVEVLGEAELEALGFRTLLAVGQGSTRESQVVILRWNGAANPGEAPVAFVGKGVCFDTGGISIKPADGMEDMKWDMGGAGAVIGLMHALAGRKAKVNAVGVLGLVENMPDGNAQRPGDIVVSLSGQTVEVLNTDAEGRLVLADALWYTQERFKPKFMVDLATLTGAIIVALGTDYAGLFANNDELADRLLAASKATGENLWRMPLPAQYEKQIESKAADLKNIGGRAGGSITAGLFLQRFVNKVPWAHLDIASTAWTNEVRTPVNPEGATGFGVRLLERFVADFYEDQ